MKIGDLVRHKSVDYGVGIVVDVYRKFQPKDRVIIYLAKQNIKCRFVSMDWEIIE